jgi:hypothetical protein
MDFWSAFWPALAANGVTFIVGVPLAILANRYAVYLAESLSRAQRDDVLLQNLRSLLNSIENSRNLLARFVEDLANRQTPMDSYLETDTWQTLRTLIAEQMRDPAIVRQLSAYFSDIESVARILTRLIEGVTAPDARLEANIAINDARRRELIRRMPQLVGDADRLIAEVNRAIAALEGPGRRSRLARLLRRQPDRPELTPGAQT